MKAGEMLDVPALPMADLRKAKLAAKQSGRHIAEVLAGDLSAPPIAKGEN